MYTGTDTAIPIPLTTRGIGIHSAIYHNTYTKTIAGVPECSAAQLYRISLLQLDVKMQINCRANLTLDDDVEITTPLAFASLFDESQNFRLISEAINSLGNFRLDDANYQPHIPAMPEKYEGNDDANARVGASSHCTTPESFDCEADERLAEDEAPRRLVPNPYLVTIHNLRQVVMALSDDNTPLAERWQFIRRNPIPSAIFEHDLLINADEIMPDDYDLNAIVKDALAFGRMIDAMRDVDENIVERVYFESHGNIALLSCVHHPVGELFAVANGELMYSGMSVVRSTGPKDSGYKFNGCCYLMSELPPDVERMTFDDAAVWAMRSRYLSNSSYETNWINAVSNFSSTQTMVATREEEAVFGDSVPVFNSHYRTMEADRGQQELGFANSRPPPVSMAFPMAMRMIAPMSMPMRMPMPMPQKKLGKKARYKLNRRLRKQHEELVGQCIHYRH